MNLEGESDVVVLRAYITGTMHSTFLVLFLTITGRMNSEGESDVVVLRVYNITSTMHSSTFLVLSSGRNIIILWIL